MPLIINKELIVTPYKTLIRENLFDFLKKRENMNLCGSKNLYQTIFKGGLFLNFYHG